MPVDAFCCEALKYHSTQRCPEHSDPFACPDQVVLRLDDGTFGLPIHDGGSSSIGINRCPWCGAALSTPD